MAQSFQVSTPAPQGQGFDMAAEQEEIARRRRLADMLRQQSAQPEGQMVSGQYVAPSITQRLASLFNAYQGGQIDQRATQRSREVGQQFRESQQGEIDSVLAALQGGQRGVEGMPDETGNPTVQMEAVPGDRQEAMRRGLRSTNPAAQQIGGTLLAQALQPPKPIDWKLGERFNEQTGRPEKFMYNPANPQQTMPVGGQQATRLDFQNTGGQIVPLDPYTGQPAGTPIARTMSPEATGRLAWDQYTWANLSPQQREQLRLQQAGVGIAAGNLGVSQANLYYNTGMQPGGGAAVPRLNLPQNAPMPGVSGAVPQGMPQGQLQPPMPQGAPQAPQQAPAGQPMPQRPAAPIATPAGQQGQIPPALTPGATPKMAAEQAAEQAANQARIQRNFPVEVRRITNNLNTIDRALGQVGMGTAGAGSPMRFVPGTSARDLQGSLATIRAGLAFGELQRMREMSPTGGALGAVSNIELNLLESAMQSLDQAQSPAQLRENLALVRQHYAKWAETLAQSAGLPSPKLPPGPAARSVTGGRVLPPAAGGGWKVEAVR
jgi:hypothetical protein